MISAEDTSFLQYQEVLLVHDSINRTLVNDNFRHGVMANNVENTVETTFEFKFARDLIRFVLHEYMTGLHWNPNGMFVERDLDSPFTPQFKDAIREVLDSHGEAFQNMHDFYFQDKSKVVERHIEYCKEFKDTFVDEIFSPKSFIMFSALLAMWTGLSYRYGARLAPYQSVLMLITAVKEIKLLGKVDDNLWNEVQDWLERLEDDVEEDTNQNPDLRHDGMDINVGPTVETTSEFKFSRDLIRFVLQDCMTGLYWIPIGMFAQHDLDSPFTPQFKKAIKNELDSRGHKYYETYDKFFSYKPRVPIIHKENCKLFKYMFVNQTFSPKNFIKFCALLGISAGLSYLYGSCLAPYQSFLVVISAVKELKNLGKVDDNLWNEVQDWLESSQ